MGTSFSPLVFSGISKYSADFQTIVDRAVSIASIPLKQMQNDQSDLLTKKQLLTNLNGAVADLAEKVAALGKLGETRAIGASSSNSSIVTATATGAGGAVTYTISEITSIASAASETSVSGYATSDKTAVSATGKVDLIVGSSTYHLDITGENNLVALRDAINAANAGVTASILTTGTGDAPNYLAVSVNSTGQTTLKLVDDPAGAARDLLTAANQGTNTVFKLNGVDVVKSNTFINDVVPGVTFTIRSKTAAGEKVTVSLRSDRSQLESALRGMVAAYNEVVSQADAQIGEAAGLLAGDPLIRQTQEALRSLVGYEGTGTIRSLAALGVELDDSGKMSFNSDTFGELTDSEIDASFEFLGSATKGLGAIAAKFTQISDPVTGLIRLEQDQFDRADSRLSDSIAELADRISSMQVALSQKLQMADALLAQLESQQALVDANVQSLNYALYGRQDG